MWTITARPAARTHPETNAALQMRFMPSSLDSELGLELGLGLGLAVCV